MAISYPYDRTLLHVKRVSLWPKSIFTLMQFPELVHFWVEHVNHLETFSRPHNEAVNFKMHYVHRVKGQIGSPMNLMPLNITYIKVNQYGHDCFPLHNNTWMVIASEPSTRCTFSGSNLSGQPWKATKNILLHCQPWHISYIWHWLWSHLGTCTFVYFFMIREYLNCVNFVCYAFVDN